MRPTPSKILRFTGERVELDAPQELAERSGLKPGDELLSFAPGGGVLLFAREPSRKGFFVGSLDTLSVAEVLGFVCSSIRSGTLVLQGPTARRRIYFRDGQICFASSTELADRLGPVLWRSGMVSLEELAECEPKVGPKAKLGKVLMDAGLLTPAQLYRGMQLQVKEIALGAFCESEGEFAFVDEGDSSELTAVRLIERTRDLVLEGMSRAEQLLQLRQFFDPSGVPKPVEGAEPTVLEQQVVMQKVDGKVMVRDVVRASRLGEFRALKAMHALVMAGRVKPPPPLPPRAPLPRQQTTRAVSSNISAVQIYNAALERVRVAMGADALRLAGYVGALPGPQRALFEGVKIAEAPDLERLVANAQKVHAGAMGRAVAMEAVDGFLAFALFEARNVLSTSRAADLARDVGRILKGK